MSRYRVMVLIVFLGASMAKADSFTYSVDVDTQETGVLDDRSFMLPAVDSIDSIVVEVAATWGGDQEMTLTAPDGTQYVPMLDETDETGSGNFDLGLMAGDPSLANVASYTFVAPTGNADYADNYAAPGTYDANSWGAGPHSAGSWQFLLQDDATGDPTSIGDVTINFTVVPEPSSVGLAWWLLFTVFAARWKK